MSELITLVGGPADGRQFRWQGGDMIQLQPLPEATMIKPVDTRPPRQLKDDRLTYRRSLVSPWLFVHQP